MALFFIVLLLAVLLGLWLATGESVAGTILRIMLRALAEASDHDDD